MASSALARGIEGSAACACLANQKKLVHEEWMTFWLRARKQKREELMEVMGSVLGLAEYGVFRTMVGFVKEV